MGKRKASQFPLTRVIMDHANPDDTIVTKAEEVLDKTFRIEGSPSEAEACPRRLDGLDDVSGVPSSNAKTDGRHPGFRSTCHVTIDGHIGPREKVLEKCCL